MFNATIVLLFTVVAAPIWAADDNINTDESAKTVFASDPFKIDKVKLPDSIVKNADSANELLTSAWHRHVGMSLSATQGIRLQYPFPSGFALKGFCSKGDMIWPGRIVSGWEVYGVIWLNAENKRCLLLAGEWDKDKKELTYPIIEPEESKKP